MSVNSTELLPFEFKGQFNPNIEYLLHDKLEKACHKNKKSNSPFRECSVTALINNIFDNVQLAKEEKKTSLLFDTSKGLACLSYIPASDSSGKLKFLAKAMYGIHGIRLTKVSELTEPRQILFEWGSDVPKSHQVLDYLKEDRKKGLFTDFTIKVGDYSYPCHKLVLAAKSPFFQKIFEGSYKDSKTNEYEFSKELNYKTIALLLDYLYEEQVVLPSETSLDIILELCAQANFLELKSLKFQCEDLLMKYIDEENVIALSEFASTYDIESLSSSCEKFPANMESKNEDLKLQSEKHS